MSTLDPVIASWPAWAQIAAWVGACGIGCLFVYVLRGFTAATTEVPVRPVIIVSEWVGPMSGACPMDVAVKAYDDRWAAWRSMVEW